MTKYGIPEVKNFDRKMADAAEIYQLLYQDSDSEAEFEGFDAEELVWNNVEDKPAYDFIPVENDRDLPSDLEMKWSSQFEDSFVPPFTGEPGINIDIDPDASRLQYLLRFISNEDFAHIANETNRYQLQGRATRVQKPHSRLNMWYDTTTEEIKKFFGVITLMGKKLTQILWAQINTK